jgi:hypothetical protein
MEQMLPQQAPTQEDAYRLVERLLNHSVPVSMIRDELTERGYSASDALQLIEQVRTATRTTRIRNPDDARTLFCAMGLFIGLMFLITVVLMLAGN